MADGLKLENVWMIWSRVEDVKQRFDYVTARAVWYADKIIPRCSPLVKKWGKLILYKILSPEEEAILIDLAEWKKLYLETMHYYKLFPDDIQRVIYIFTKE
jgi:16S rRNA G527 N7-methylase RsmG